MKNIYSFLIGLLFGVISTYFLMQSYIKKDIPKNNLTITIDSMNKLLDKYEPLRDSLNK